MIYHGSLLIIHNNIDFTVYNIEDIKQNIKKSNGKLIGYKFEKIYT